jgi:hypothetical protein
VLPTKFQLILPNGEASMDGSQLRLLISSRSVNKHGHQDLLHMAAIEILRKLSSFREDILEIDPLETRIACGGHVC